MEDTTAAPVERGLNAPAGHWKVRKIRQSHKIDGLVAAVIAYGRAARQPAGPRPAFAVA